MREMCRRATGLILLITLMAGGTMVMAEAGAKLENVKQPPMNTTMMGVLKGAADYHGLELDAAMVYGLSGHAFLINIHKQLCPSGPYCWKRENAAPLIANMGLQMTDHGFFGTGVDAEKRAAVEQSLRAALDKGIPCSLINLENQLIDGYDAEGFFTAQPWAPNHKFPPAKLSFGSWKEFGKTFHANFYTIEKTPPADRRAAILASLDYAVDMWKNPDKHSSDAFGAGPKAYDNWIAAVPECGASHGNWWNATVWGECRRMAADYCSRIGDDDESVSDLCLQLKDQYLKISQSLGKASNKAMDADQKVALLEETKKLEAAAINDLEKLAKALRSHQQQDE